MTRPLITPVDQCIAYIESCGWKLETRERRWYRFNRVTPAEGKSNFIAFTMTELRDAFNHGW